MSGLIGASVDYYYIEVLIGLSCMMNWLALIKYMSYSKDYAFIPRALMRSAPLVARVAIGAIPLFFGFAFLGMTLFYEWENFGSFSRTLFMLVAMMNGD